MITSCLVDIKNYEGLYYVTTEGKVFTYGRPRKGNGVGQHSTLPKEIAQFKKRNGYLAINLFCAAGKIKQYTVHKLIADAFCFKPNDATQVNHKDLNRTNNNVSNLEWVTPSQNMQHAKAAGVLCGGGRNKFTSEQVDIIRTEYFSGKTLKEVAKQFNCGEVTVWRAVHKIGRNTKHLHYEIKD